MISRLLANEEVWMAAGFLFVWGGLWNLVGYVGIVQKIKYRKDNIKRQKEKY